MKKIYTTPECLTYAIDVANVLLQGTPQLGFNKDEEFGENDDDDIGVKKYSDYNVWDDSWTKER